MIYHDITETIGETPLVRINKINLGPGEVLAKVEYFNPGSSVKDRVALSMVQDAEKRGVLKAGGTIIEPTSGNTGIGLALVAAVRGYRMILVMPDTMSVERRRLAEAYGSEVVLTPGADGMLGSIHRAEELQREIPNSMIAQQFENPANPAAHRATAEEIWRDCEGKIDVFVAGVGTGGTLTGVGSVLREKNPALSVVAVEPADSPLLTGGQPGPHKLQGIGANFIPKILDRALISEVADVGWEDAGEMARKAACQEGLLIGISSGAALDTACKIAQRPDSAGKRIVVLLPDCGERYLSTWLFNPQH